MKVAVLVVAAGRGSRFGSVTPKQYLPLHGQAILRHSLATFAAHPAIGAIRVVINPADRSLYDLASAGLGLLEPVDGGAERQDSVRLGLQSLAEMNFDAVLIHDAARPFVGRAVIDRVIGALSKAPGVVPGIPVADTLKRTRNDIVTATVPRDGLWRVQTPQGFRMTDILAAHTAVAGQALTDDAAVLEAAGGTVIMVPGDAENIKVTMPDDISLAAIEAPRPLETRTGFGLDVHAFTDGDAVTICGVEIPFRKSLSGHSDADVAMHALTDALYGAIGAGDIGHHFPPSDARWKGCASAVFLRHAAALITARSGRITHVDVTIACEAPRIGPHRIAMTNCLADILNISAGRVSVKATTTEKLGFTGRGEGIAAQAVATVMVPVTDN